MLMWLVFWKATVQSLFLGIMTWPCGLRKDWECILILDHPPETTHGGKKKLMYNDNNIFKTLCSNDPANILLK